MTELPPNENAPEAMPQADVTHRRGISVVWIVPLIAAALGGWLAWRALSEKGPTITISFATAEGLEAGKTKIRYKDVEVGQIDTISLDDDLARVEVTAELDRRMAPFLTDQTRFWVVRARVAAGEVSGLGTLFSGAYVGIDPARDGKRAEAFVGLEVPPVVTGNLPGRHFVLHAERRGSLDVGAPVFYRQIEVGQVVRYVLDDDGEGLTFQVFVEAPHHERVRHDTRFWNASGIDVEIRHDGLTVDMESIVSVLTGGIAFGAPPHAEPGPAAKDGATFDLYPSRRAVDAPIYAEKETYLVYFDASVRGLEAGASVEFRGIRIGTVRDVKLRFDVDALDFRVPVLVDLELDRIEFTGGGRGPGAEMIAALVERGLRAQLKTGSFLTGQLFIDLDFHREAPTASVTLDGEYRVLPSVPTPLEEITAGVTRFINRLEDLPVENLADEAAAFTGRLNESLEQSRALVEGFNTKLLPAVTGTLETLQALLGEVQAAIGRDSTVYHEIRRGVTELADTARAVRVLTGYLERHPESIIYGKPEETR